MNSLTKPTFLAALLALLLAAPAFAQSTSTQFTLNGLTREGTVITNVATANYTDANNNPYAQVSAQVSVTVGYLAALDIQSPAAQTPVSPSQNNALPIVLKNNGNGPDFFALSVSIPEGIENVRYVLDGVTYADLAALNAVLAARSVEADYTLDVTILYDVLDGYGGMPLDFPVTVNSVRDPNQPGGSDTSTTVITPVRTDSVVVTPDNGVQQRLPSNGTLYTATYVVTNGGNVAETFNLAATVDGAVLSVVSVNGVSGVSTSLRIRARQSVEVTVVYTVADDAAAGMTNALVLTATSQGTSGVSDTGTYAVTVIRPALSMTKQAFRDDQTPIGSGTVLPGEYVRYRISVTNGGTALAEGVVVTDALPVELVYVGTEEDAEGWTFGVSGNTVTANLAGGLQPGASRFIWIRARVK